jgi:ubiquitin C-terminal hydrolase
MDEAEKIVTFNPHPVEITVGDEADKSIPTATIVLPPSLDDEKSSSTVSGHLMPPSAPPVSDVIGKDKEEKKNPDKESPKSLAKTKEKDKEVDVDTRILSGLTNLGLTCYMNSALQALCGTNIFAGYFNTHEFNKDLKDNIMAEMCTKQEEEHKKIMKESGKDEAGEEFEFSVNIDDITRKKKRTISYALYTLFNYMWSENCEVSPVDFKRLVNKHLSAVSGFNQEDSAEFLIVLLDRLNSELRTGYTMKDISILTPDVKEFTKEYNKMNAVIEAEKDSEEKLKLMENLLQFKRDNFEKFVCQNYVDYWKRYLKGTEVDGKYGNYSVVTDVFGFSNVITVECDECHNQSCSFEADTMIKLPVPKDADEVKLTDLFKTQSELVERMEKADKYACSICEKKVNASKRHMCWDYPERMIIQLKLFNFELKETPMGWMPVANKTEARVKFPHKIDMSPYKSDLNPDDKEYKYELYAIIKHSGNTRGGHYVAYVKNMINGQWFLFDDDDVWGVVKEEVDDVKPYMLFYRRLNIMDEIDSDDEEDYCEGSCGAGESKKESEDDADSTTVEAPHDEGYDPDDEGTHNIVSSSNGIKNLAELHMAPEA